MRIDRLTPVYVKHIPQPIEPGILYISKEFYCSIHGCPCGCNEEVVLSFRPGGAYSWDMTENDGKVSFRPSIGNFSYNCKSHYFIVDNEIKWC